jgi:squalene-hopene/tetraprenyl-beta-curcumene cyclase
LEGRLCGSPSWTLAPRRAFEPRFTARRPHVAVIIRNAGLQSQPPSEAAIQPGIKRMIEYLRKGISAQTPLDGAALLWASATIPNLLTGAEQRSIVADLLAKQRDNGGFGASDLVGAWQRRDNTSLDKASDGYATGLIALALEQIGEPLTKPKLDRAISWLRHSQDPSDGRWPASSLNKQRELSSDAGRFMSDAATAYAVMAIENAK